ncbi:MAG: hypothetical protein P8O93_06940 [Flavobacteriaceae bacterium]|jgi:hypothetical protein|nr:hypothetical protein [Flavobacteriaceae bacterium]
MKKLLFLMALAFSVTAFAQESKAYLSLSVGASLPGGDIADAVDLGTGIDLGIGFGYRFTEQWGATLNLGSAASAYDDANGDTAAFGAGFFSVGPMYTLGLGGDWSWDIKPQYVFSLSGVDDQEGGDFDSTLSGTGLLFGNSFVKGLGSGFKLAINLDYLSGSYSEVEVDGETFDIDEDNGYSKLSIGVGVRYNF